MLPDNFTVLVKDTLQPSIVLQNQFDKKGLTTTCTQSLVNSLLGLRNSIKLNNLAILHNGGLELLVSRTRELSTSTHHLAPLGFSLCVAILSNIVSKGSFDTRYRLFLAGIADILYPLFERFIVSNVSAVNSIKQLKKHWSQSHSRTKSDDMVIQHSIERLELALSLNPPMQVQDTNEHNSHHQRNDNVDLTDDQEVVLVETNNHPLGHIDTVDNFVHPHDLKLQDLIHSTKIIAYISKYPETRRILHEREIYLLIEQLSHPAVPTELRKWSWAALRAAIRREPNRAKMCARLECRKIEPSPRSFGKCSSCRRVVYCSKNCQSLAWVHHQV
jgi:MYND finger